MKIIDVSEEVLAVMPPETATDLAGQVEKWLSLQEFELDRLVVDDLPALQYLGYGRDALVALGTWLVGQVPRPRGASSFSVEQTDYMARAARFFGQCLIQNFHGEWVLTSEAVKNNSPLPSIMLPYGRPLFSVFEKARSAVVKADPNYFAQIFSFTERAYADWVTQGGNPAVVKPID